jgi:Flp pilus assembly protein protease CpaA
MIVTMTAFPFALGTLAGLAFGWLAWLVAARFTARYRAAALAPGSAPAPAGNGDQLPLGAALTLAGMALWGGWMGYRAVGIPVAVSALVVTALLLCVTLVDLRVRRIPNELVLALLAWAGVQILWLGWPGWGAAGLGLLVAGGIFFLLALAGRGAMGLGDVKLEAALGALLGYPAVLAAIFLGVVAGGVAAAFLLLTQCAGRKDPIAYSPYLALGAWLVYAQVLGLWPG